MDRHFLSIDIKGQTGRLQSRPARRLHVMILRSGLNGSHLDLSMIEVDPMNCTQPGVPQESLLMGKYGLRLMRRGREDESNVITHDADFLAPNRGAG